MKSIYVDEDGFVEKNKGTINQKRNIVLMSYNISFTQQEYAK